MLVYVPCLDGTCTCGPAPPPPEPCECTIEYDTGTVIKLLPEFLMLTIAPPTGYGECCGGDWLGGCWILRNAYAFGGTTDEELKKIWYAVDPDDVSQVLRPRVGDADAETCDGIVEATPDDPNDQEHLIDLQISILSSGTIRDLYVDIIMSKMLTPSHPTDDYYYNYAQYTRESSSIDLCDTALIHTIDAEPTDGLLANCYDSDPPLSEGVFFPTSVDIQPVCQPFPDCDGQPGLITVGCCTNGIPRQLPFAIVGPWPVSTTLTYDGANLSGPGWYGSVVVPGACGSTWPISLKCVDGDFLLSINGVICIVALNELFTCSPFMIITPLDPRECVTDGGTSSSTVLPCSYAVVGTNDGSVENWPSPLSVTPVAYTNSPTVVLTSTGGLSLSSGEYIGTFRAVSDCGFFTIDQTFNLRMYCSGGAWRLEITRSGFATQDIAAVSSSCDPVSYVFETANVFVDCNAVSYGIRFTVTE